MAAAARVRPALVAALAALLVALSAVAQPAAAQTVATPAKGAGSTPQPKTTVTVTTQVDPNAAVGVTDLDAHLPLRRLTGRQVLAIAARTPDAQRTVREHKGAYPGVYTKGAGRWQVSYFSRDKPPKELAQLYVDDATGAVTEHYTGYKVAWTMARGYPGAFGKKVNDPLVWIGLTVAFLLPFVPRRRRDLSWLPVDLAVLAAFGISVAFFNDADIAQSVPIATALLAYVLGRMLWLGLRSRPERDRPRRLPVLVPTAWLAIGIVFLLGFRIGLNVTDSNVIDVGYASVVGADRLEHGQKLYANFPTDVEHGDTYGPVTYAAYVPFELAMPWSGRWDDLAAAHGAAIAFDLLACLLCFLVGRRVRGPDLGIVLAYCWAAFPFTLYVESCNANDALVSVFVLLALAVAERPGRRGAMAALGGLTKFATLALAPVFATYGGVRKDPRQLVFFGVAFLALAIAVMGPLVAGGQSLSLIYDRTIGYQADRGAPFSVWGLYGWDTGQKLWEVAAVALALGIAVVPRRQDLVGLAACAAAVVVALQLSATYWFYLYIVWFFPLVLVALLGRFGARGPQPPVQASSTGSIAVALSGSEAQVMSTAFSHGSSSEVS